MIRADRYKRLLPSNLTELTDSQRRNYINGIANLMIRDALLTKWWILTTKVIKYLARVIGVIFCLFGLLQIQHGYVSYAVVSFVASFIFVFATRDR